MLVHKMIRGNISNMWEVTCRYRIWRSLAWDCRTPRSPRAPRRRNPWRREADPQVPGSEGEEEIRGEMWDFCKIQSTSKKRWNDEWNEGFSNSCKWTCRVIISHSVSTMFPASEGLVCHARLKERRGRRRRREAGGEGGDRGRGDEREEEEERGRSSNRRRGRRRRRIERIPGWWRAGRCRAWSRSQLRRNSHCPTDPAPWRQKTSDVNCWLRLGWFLLLLLLYSVSISQQTNMGYKIRHTRLVYHHSLYWSPCVLIKCYSLTEHTQSP